jgi:phage host-nuclease inhibitor protein Gam
MPRQSSRKAPAGNYSQAPRNMRNFVLGKSVLRQGVITDETQNVRNVEHVIKYLQSNAFKRKIKETAEAEEESLLLE